MELNYKNFPSLDEAQKLILKAKEIKWPIYQDDEDVEDYIKKIKDIFFSYFHFLAFPVTILKATDIQLSLYRVRELSKFQNIDLFCEHSYPPIAFTGLGRCNFPKHPIFYSSNNPATALTEVIREYDFTEKQYCISRWGILQNSQINVVTQNFLYSDLPKNNFFKQLNDSELKKYDETFKDNLTTSQKDGLKEVLKYLHNEFSNDQNYGISAMLSHSCFYSKHKLCADILIYPGNKSKKVGNNFAVHPNFADNMLELQKLYIIDVESYESETNKFSMRFLRQGNVIDNKIIWSYLPEDQYEFNKIVKEDFTGIVEI